MRRWRRDRALLLATGLLTACVKSPTEPVDRDERDGMDASYVTESDAQVADASQVVPDAQLMGLDASRPCVTNNDCAGRQDGKLQCASNGACVECKTNAECTLASAPLCTNNTCQPCAQDAECGRFSATPVCGPAGACVACRADAAAVCTLQGTVCIAGGNTCTNCNVNADCKDATKPICEAHDCRACTADADCAGTSQVCHESTGRCVACEPNAQAPAMENCANGLACAPETLTCVGKPRRSLDRCGAMSGAGDSAIPCVSDSECIEGLRCVMTEFPRGTTYKMYCLSPRREGSCPLQYPLEVNTKSALGVMDTYCMPNYAHTTCDGLRGFRRACGQDTDCGAVGIGDGLCIGADAQGMNGMGQGKCSYGCDSSLDCALNECTGSKGCPLQ